MKQLALAEAIGEPAINIYYGSNENVDEDKLQLVAEALEVSVEAIRNLVRKG